MIPEAIKDRFDHIKDPNWTIWRCPHCNAWDWALQGPVSVHNPIAGVHTCEECGKPFEIKGES